MGNYVNAQKPSMMDLIITEREFTKLLKSRSYSGTGKFGREFQTGGSLRHFRSLKVDVDPETLEVKALYSTQKNSAEVELTPLQKERVVQEIKRRDTKMYGSLVSNLVKAMNEYHKNSPNCTFAEVATPIR